MALALAVLVKIPVYLPIAQEKHITMSEDCKEQYQAAIDAIEFNL
jgi:hypothetical protein